MRKETHPLPAPWLRASYRIITFLLLSTLICLTNVALSLNNPYSNIIGASSLLCASIYGFLSLSSTSISLSAITYFLLGSGLWFSGGTVLLVFLPNISSYVDFSESMQSKYLPLLNLLHSVSILIVFIFCLLVILISNPAEPDRNKSPFHFFKDGRSRFAYISLIFSYSVMALIEYYALDAQPIFSDIAYIRLASSFLFFIAGSNWKEIDRFGRSLILISALIHVLLGLLDLSKSSSIINITTLICGMMCSYRISYLTTRYAVFVILLYFIIVAPTVALGRISILYDPVNSGFSDRLHIILNVISANNIRNPEVFESIISRFTIAQFESYFIGLYYSGYPGDTLERPWEILIPRIFWSEKPVFQSGRYFDLIIRDYEAITALAIGYVAESYWNYGWIGVICISALIGVEYGWLTLRWMLFCKCGTDYVGVAIFTPIIVYQSILSQGAITEVYIGGFVQKVLLITTIDYIVRYVKRARLKKSEQIAWKA